MGLLNEIQNIVEEFCDKYCKYPDMYKGSDEDEGCEKLFKERCENCPLTKL